MLARSFMRRFTSSSHYARDIAVFALILICSVWLSAWITVGWLQQIILIYAQTCEILRKYDFQYPIALSPA